LIAIGGYVKQHQLGYVTSADGGYMISGERYIPDVAFISKARQPEPSHDAYNPKPPDLAVEVLSPTDDPFDVRTKVVNYLRAGTTVWVVDPEKKRVEVYKPDETPIAVGLAGSLADEDILPGFTLAIEEIFPD
jgi:Uma2 family endonuclease